MPKAFELGKSNPYEEILNALISDELNTTLSTHLVRTPKHAKEETNDREYTISQSLYNT